MDDLPAQEAAIGMALAVIFCAAFLFLSFLAGIFCHDCSFITIQIALTIPTALLTLTTLAGGFLVIFAKRTGLYLLVLGLGWDEAMTGLTFLGGWYEDAPLVLFFTTAVGYLLFRFFETILATRINQTVV